MANELLFCRFEPECREERGQGRNLYPIDKQAVGFCRSRRSLTIVRDDKNHALVEQDFYTTKAKLINNRVPLLIKDHPNFA